MLSKESLAYLTREQEIAVDALPRTGDDGKLASYAWPGGYPISYVTAQRAVCCPDCANEIEADINAADDMPNDKLFEMEDLCIKAGINYEDSDLQCDLCGADIEAAYE